MNKFNLLIGILLLLSLSCNLINPEEPTPAYLFINHFSVKKISGTGSTSSKITDAWAYVDDQPVGVVELPAKIPVLSTGLHKITIAPGIMNNGQSVDRIKYPFYKGYTIQHTLTAGEIDSLSPETEYTDGLHFELINDFETSNDFIGMGITTASNKVFEGNKSGEIIATKTIPEFDALSSDYNLPGGGTRIYLEMDYYCDAAFNVYVQSNNFAKSEFVKHYVISISKKQVWNKIYIDLTSAVSGNPADSYQLVFSGSKPAEADQAGFYFDNVKIITF